MCLEGGGEGGNGCIEVYIGSTDEFSLCKKQACETGSSDSSRS